MDDQLEETEFDDWKDHKDGIAVLSGAEWGEGNGHPGELSAWMAGRQYSFLQAGKLFGLSVWYIPYPGERALPEQLRFCLLYFTEKDDIY